MGTMIPQKAFDSQLHIIRDVHFDVDKYKVGELYVINNTLEGIADNDDIKTFQGNKVIGRLVKANKDSLIFEVPVYFKDPNTGGIYSFENITLSIDVIINYRIEIERLLTETEAALYLASEFVKESAEDLFKSQLAWQKGPVGVNYFCTPEKHQDDTSKECAKDIEAKQSTLDPKDPKFNRLLGIAPDHSQFPYTLERTHSYQELQAAYKIDEETAKECVDYGQVAKDLVVAEMVKHRDSRYLMSHLKSTSQSLPYVLTFINDKGEFDPTPFKDMVGTIKITMSKGTSEIVWYTAKRNIRIVPNTIEIRNRNGTVQMILTKDTFFLMFDKITFEDQQ